MTHGCSCAITPWSEPSNKAPLTPINRGYTLELDYGSGEDSELIATLVSTAARPTIHAFAASPSGITLGASTTLTWEVGSFDQLTIEPGIGNVNGSTIEMVKAKGSEPLPKPRPMN